MQNAVITMYIYYYKKIEYLIKIDVFNNNAVFYTLIVKNC